MSTLREPCDIDPRVYEANERLDYYCSALRTGQMVRHKSTGEVGIVVRTWYNEELDAQDCYVCFDDGGNPYFDPDDKCGPYVLRYLASTLEPLPCDEDPGIPWERYDYQEDAELEIITHLYVQEGGKIEADDLEKYYQEEVPAKLKDKIPVAKALQALLDKGYVEEVSEGEYHLTSKAHEHYFPYED